MYEDYDDYDPYLDDLDDDIDMYNDQIEEYDYQLSNLEDNESMLDDRFENDIQDIDDYWDRENEYIKSSGIYTDEEVAQILENHEQIRNSKKEELRSTYDIEKRFLDDERGHIQFDREMAESELDQAISDREDAAAEREVYQPVNPVTPTYTPPEKPSFLKRTMSAVGIYYMLKKIFLLGIVLLLASCGNSQKTSSQADYEWDDSINVSANDTLDETQEETLIEVPPPPREYDAPPPDDEDYDNMRGFDPASEDDMPDNGMSRYMENNDEEGWD